jgi:hypothetical protein
VGKAGVVKMHLAAVLPSLLLAGLLAGTTALSDASDDGRTVQMTVTPTR